MYVEYICSHYSELVELVEIFFLLCNAGLQTWMFSILCATDSLQTCLRSRSAPNRVTFPYLRRYMSSIYYYFSLTKIRDQRTNQILWVGVWPIAMDGHISCMHVIHVCHACMTCTYVMHVCHAHMSCMHVIHICHACMSFTYVMHVCHACMSCMCVMVLCRDDVSQVLPRLLATRVRYVCHVGMSCMCVMFVCYAFKLCVMGLCHLCISSMCHSCAYVTMMCRRYSRGC